MGFRIGFVFSRGSRPQMVGKHPPADSPWAFPRGRDASPNTGPAQSCLESGPLLPVHTTRPDGKGAACGHPPPRRDARSPRTHSPCGLGWLVSARRDQAPHTDQNSCWGHTGLVRFFLMLVYNHVLEEPTSRKRPGAQKARMPRWPQGRRRKMTAAPGSCADQGSSPHLRVTPRDATEVTSHSCGKPTPRSWDNPLQLLRTVCLPGILQGESLASDAKKGKGPVHTGVPEGQLI